MVLPSTKGLTRGKISAHVAETRHDEVPYLFHGHQTNPQAKSKQASGAGTMRALACSRWRPRSARDPTARRPRRPTGPVTEWVPPSSRAAVGVGANAFANIAPESAEGVLPWRPSAGLATVGRKVRAGSAGRPSPSGLGQWMWDPPLTSYVTPVR